MFKYQLDILISGNYLIVGTIGTFQGYTDSPLWLYNNGVWSNLQQTGVTKTSGNATSYVREVINPIAIQILVTSYVGDIVVGRLNQSVDLTSYNYVNVNISRFAPYMTLTIGVSSNANIVGNGGYDAIIVASGTGKLKLNVSGVSGNKFIYFNAVINNNSGSMSDLVNEIYLTTV